MKKVIAVDIRKVDVASFLNDWLRTSIPNDVFAEAGDKTLARALAQLCRQQAADRDISPADLDRAARQMIPGGDNLVELIGYAIDYAAIQKTCALQQECAEFPSVYNATTQR